MKILVLGPYKQKLVDYLQSNGDEVIVIEEKIEADSDILEGIEFIISFGYRYKY